MYTGQGANPAQLNGLTANTKLVTVSIGGNDIGFGQIVYGCAVQSVYTSPAAPCRTRLTAGGTDTLAARITAVGPKLLSLYKTIKTRAPGAKVLVVGYPTIFSPTTCPGGFSRADTDYLSKDFAGLNNVVKTQAEVAGATYVDTASSSSGHGFCAPVAQRWLENRTVTHPAVAWHPNGMSMSNTASQIVSAAGSSE
jgi:lysophospholipase L1-like esterase